MTPEFSRTYALDTLCEPKRVTIEADAGERAALVERFDLLGLDSLTAQATLTRNGTIVAAEGHLAAKVLQSCVASGEPMPQTIEEPFAVRFVPETEAVDEEVEVSEEPLDDIAYTGGAIDLGEAVAQTLVLALDPFPRSPNADAILRAAGVRQESEVSASPPLAGLADLFRK